MRLRFTAVQNCYFFWKLQRFGPMPTECGSNYLRWHPSFCGQPCILEVFPNLAISLSRLYQGILSALVLRTMHCVFAGDYIGTNGVRALAQALKVNTTIQHLMCYGMPLRFHMVCGTGGILER